LTAQKRAIPEKNGPPRVGGESKKKVYVQLYGQIPRGKFGGRMVGKGRQVEGQGRPGNVNTKLKKLAHVRGSASRGRVVKKGCKLQKGT